MDDGHGGLYYDAARKLASALVHEEDRCGFVSREVAVLSAVSAEMTRGGGGPAADQQALCDALLSHSVLANDLRLLFNALTPSGALGGASTLDAGGGVAFVLNRWVRLTVRSGFRHATADAAAATASLCGTATAPQHTGLPPRIRPYHALFLLQPAAAVLQQLHPEASSQVVLPCCSLACLCCPVPVRPLCPHPLCDAKVGRLRHAHRPCAALALLGRALLHLPVPVPVVSSPSHPSSPPLRNRCAPSWLPQARCFQLQTSRVAVHRPFYRWQR